MWAKRCKMADAGVGALQGAACQPTATAAESVHSGVRLPNPRSVRSKPTQDALEGCDAEARGLIAEYEKARKLVARAAGSGAQDAEERVRDDSGGAARGGGRVREVESGPCARGAVGACVRLASACDGGPSGRAVNLLPTRALATRPRPPGAINQGAAHVAAGVADPARA